MIGNAGTQKKLHLCGEVIGIYAARRSQRTQTALERHLPGIIQRARDIRSSNKCFQQRLLPEIISRWKGIKAEQDQKNKICGHLFNPLASIPIGETTQSLLLGDLLDPRGSHGQGRLLLETFLKRIDVPDPKEGDWVISVEKEGRVDICLSRSSPPSVVLIENKSNCAGDQPNQLYRYWYWNIHKPNEPLDYTMENTKLAFQIIYLPPVAGTHPADHSLQCPKYLAHLKLGETLRDVGVTVRYLNFRDHITAWLDDCEKHISPTNARLRTFLQFYKERWA